MAVEVNDRALIRAGTAGAVLAVICCAAPLLAGGTLSVEPDALVLEAPGRAPLRRRRPAGSIWLPFGGG